MVERVVGIPVQTLDDMQRTLGNNLVTFPHGLRGILVDHRQGVVVGRAVTRRPRTVRILGVQRRVEVVHSVEDRSTCVAHRNTNVLAIHGIHTDRDVQTVLQDL